MIRKLAVTVAGSLINDPYLQILVALLILVVSCVATAFVQPYETKWLNMLDTLGLFALIVTQILSIVYFYVEVARNPFMDPRTLEIVVTASLFLLNAVVTAAVAFAYTSEMFGARTFCAGRRAIILKVVVDGGLVDAALQSASADVDAPRALDAATFWRHPSGVAVADPPTRAHEIDGTFTGVWVWQNSDLPVAASSSTPELLLRVVSVAELRAGDTFRRMSHRTCVLSHEEVKAKDVGGWCSSTHHDAIRNASDDVEHPAEEESDGADEEESDGADGEDVEHPVVQMQKNPMQSGLVQELAVLGGWYYEDTNDTSTMHGPFSLRQLQEWVAEGHFKQTDFVSRGCHGGDWVTIAAAGGHRDRDTAAADDTAADDYATPAPSVQTVSMKTNPLLSERSDEWFYKDVDDAAMLHGPFTMQQLADWVADGHFAESDLVRRGKDGAEVTIKHAKGLSNGIAYLDALATLG